MKLFLDTANLDEIREIKRWGVLGGLTTNPSLLAREKGDWRVQAKEVCAEVDGDVSLETTATDVDAILQQGRELAEIAPNVVVKVAMVPEGLEAGAQLVREGIPVNVTLVFTAAQALLAAAIGARYVSPFLGRLDDIGTDGLRLLEDVCEIYQMQGVTTQVLAASLRHPVHVVEAARLGADVGTMPHDVFTQLIKHPLTTSGLEKFLADWKSLTDAEGA